MSSTWRRPPPTVSSQMSLARSHRWTRRVPGEGDSPPTQVEGGRPVLDPNPANRVSSLSRTTERHRAPRPWPEPRRATRTRHRACVQVGAVAGLSLPPLVHACECDPRVPDRGQELRAAGAVGARHARLTTRGEAELEDVAAATGPPVGEPRPASMPARARSASTPRPCRPARRGRGRRRTARPAAHRHRRRRAAGVRHQHVAVARRIEGAPCQTTGEEAHRRGVGDGRDRHVGAGSGPPPNSAAQKPRIDAATHLARTARPGLRSPVSENALMLATYAASESASIR